MFGSTALHQVVTLRKDRKHFLFLKKSRDGGTGSFFYNKLSLISSMKLVGSLRTQAVQRIVRLRVGTVDHGGLRAYGYISLMLQI
jgi:hypothetical protein